MVQPSAVVGMHFGLGLTLYTLMALSAMGVCLSLILCPSISAATATQLVTTVVLFHSPAEAGLFYPTSHFKQDMLESMVIQTT